MIERTFSPGEIADRMRAATLRLVIERTGLREALKSAADPEEIRRLKHELQYTERFLGLLQRLQTGRSGSEFPESYHVHSAETR